MEWNSRNSTGFSRCGVLPGPSLSRLEENNDKSKLRPHLLCRKEEKAAEVNRVECEFTNGTEIFRSFRLEREKWNTGSQWGGGGGGERITLDVLRHRKC